MKSTAAVIADYFEAFNARNVEARLATLSEDVRHDINEGAAEIGRDAFAKFIAHMDERYEEQIADLVIFENGTRGAAEFTVNGKYVKTDDGLPEATGQIYSIQGAAFFDVVEGEITRVTSYYSLNGWIAAIGGQ